MKRWLILIGVAVTGLVTMVWVDDYYRQQIRRENGQALVQTVEDFQDELSLAIQLRLVAVEDLKVFMLTPPALPDGRTFDRFAAGLLANYPAIRAAQYTDTDRIIRYIYPLAGNEAALNLDLKTNPSIIFVEKAIRERRTTVSDPIITVQGSLSIVARAPLYRSDEFMGLVQGVFDIGQILEKAGANLKPPYQFQLHDSTGSQFWGAETIAGETQTVEVPVGDNLWRLTLGWDTPPYGLNPLTLLLIWGGGGLLLLSLLFIVNQSWLKTEWLARAVAEQTAELRYQANVLQNVFDAIIVTDLNFVIQSWNKGAETVYGWPADKAIGQRMSDLIPTSYPEDEAEAVMAHFLSQGFWQGEVVQQHRDGTAIDILTSVSLLKDEKGQPVGTVAVNRDVTQRKQAQEALRSSQAHLEIAQAEARMGSWELSLERQTGFWSQEMFRLLRRDPAAGVPLMDEFFKLVHPDDVARIQAAHVRAVDTAQQTFVEYRTHPACGPVRSLLATIQVLHFEAGRPISLVGTVQDITERKQAEEVVQRYNQRLMLLHEIDQDIIMARSPQAIADRLLKQICRFLPCTQANVMLYEPETNEMVVFASSINGDPAVEEGVGFPLSPEALDRLELKQMTVIGDIQTLPEPVEPALRPLIATNNRAYISVPLGVQGDLIGVLALASTTPVAFTGEHQEIIGEVASQLAIALHQAQLKEQIQRHTAELEERVDRRTAALQAALNRTETLYQAAQSLILPGDLTQLLQGVVDSVAKVLPADRVTLFTFDHNARKISHWIKGGPGASKIFPVPYVELLDGLSGWVLRNSRPALSPKGKPDPRESPVVQQRRLETDCGSIIVVPLQYEGQILGTLTAINGSDEPDFTEQDVELMMALAHQSAIGIINVGLQESLIRAKEQAEAADRLKSAFLATMSHELRTPLNSIIGFTGIMLQGLAGPLSSEQSKQLGMVRASANHLLALINDVLDLSKIEAGQMELAVEAVDMHQVIERASQMTAPLADKQGLTLQVEIAPEIGRVRGDRRRLEQILINLINNAIKFTEEGEVRVRCQVNDGHVVTQVSDTGIGLKREDLDELFKPFRQLEIGLARRREGSGLGLSICQKLVTLMGGQISVASEGPGRGSTFTVTLPRGADRPGEEPVRRPKL